ncbi:MAG TPA: S41 family peptidase [Sphingobacteriaceae bacterium]
MKRFIIVLAVSFTVLHATGQETQLDKDRIREDLEQLLRDLSENYAYLREKNIDLNCLRNHYTRKIRTLKNEEDVVLLYEYLLDEFYDSHLILTTNRQSSFRLHAPLYVSLQNGKAVITQVWQSRMEDSEHDLVGGEISRINGVDFSRAIDNFPTHCQNKKAPAVREWIANKLLAGRYNEPRVLSVTLLNGRTIRFNLDSVRHAARRELLTSERRGHVGVISINNSLGNHELISAFDRTLDSLMGTEALVIDLRNTVDGGNSYVARGIMGRFVAGPQPYQKHSVEEKYDDGPRVERSWTEYVSPRGTQYTRPVFVLVGRWTGSMAEGLAIGFEGIRRGTVVGTEMERLAGEMTSFGFKHRSYGYRISTARLFHVNGTPREEYVPTHYVKQTTARKDEVLERAFQLIDNL